MQAGYRGSSSRLLSQAVRLDLILRLRSCLTVSKKSLVKKNNNIKIKRVCKPPVLKKKRLIVWIFILGKEGNRVPQYFFHPRNNNLPRK